MIRLLLVYWYIIHCVRLKTFPGNFFQLNASYFNTTKGIFSKLDIDRCIPERWRLSQDPLAEDFTPTSWPVFLKPEWGQNSHGIMRIDSLKNLRKTQAEITTAAKPRQAFANVNYIVQEAAPGLREFEVFYIRSHVDMQKYALISVTEVLNSCMDRYPINGIHNKCTAYKDRSAEFSKPDLDVLWNFFSEICAYRIARVSLRADSIKDILTGNFRIIEINIFLPMPLFLLDKNITWPQKNAFIKKSMLLTARLTKGLANTGKKQSIFFKKLLAHYKLTKIKL